MKNLETRHSVESNPHTEITYVGNTAGMTVVDQIELAKLHPEGHGEVIHPVLHALKDHQIK